MPVLMPVLLVAAANTLVGSAADGAHDALMGRMLEEVQFAPERVLGHDTPVRRPYDAALVHYLGYWSHFSARHKTSSWPLPATGECAELARFGREHRLLVDEPAPGDVFLLWGPARRGWIRAGIVMSAEPGASQRGREPSFVCQTVEGDSNTKFRIGGGRVLRCERTLSVERGDRFVRWESCNGVANSRAALRRRGAACAALNGVLPANGAGLAVAAA